MPASDIAIPYGAYWSTPFSRWQGSLSHLNSVEFAAHVAKAAMARRNISPQALDYAVLGTTVPQHHSFYGTPWLTGMIGAPHVAGPTINQACATSVRCLSAAAEEIDAGAATVTLVVTADRCSNGPMIYYPNPLGPGGAGVNENWVLDNFSNDPFAKVAMVDTAENCARKWQITTAEQHEVVLRRQAQYDEALADDAAFMKRYMELPFAVPDARYAKTVKTIAGDEGVVRSTADGLAKLRPVKPDGSVTFGGQTHPADGNCGMIVTTPEKAAEMQSDKIAVRVLGFGQARTEKAHMPAATVPAARKALEAAGIDIRKIDAVKSHNPFAVNDIVFARETGFPLEKMNNYGCSLIWGHPQGPTGMRSIIELIEELALRGGGYGLFQGCAAGDTGMAVVIKVGDK